MRIFRVNPIEGEPPVEGTRTETAAKQRVEDYIGHSVAMLDALSEQSLSQIGSVEAQNEIKEIYKQAKERLDEFKEKLVAKYETPERNLTKKEIKEIAKDLKAAAKETATIVQEAKIETLGAIAKTYQETTPQTNEVLQPVKSLDVYVKSFAKGGWKSRLLKAKSKFPLLFPGVAEAKKSFEQAKNVMVEQSQKPLAKLDDETTLHAVTREAFASDALKELGRRAGVVAYQDVVRLAAVFDKSNIEKQVRSFHAQHKNLKPREVIQREFEITESPGIDTIKTTLTPVNANYDRAMGDATTVFGKIYGEAGISSEDRFNPHVVNFYHTKLEGKSAETGEARTIFNAHSHGILSAPGEKNLAKRAEYTRQMAKELLQAAVMQELSKYPPGTPFPDPLPISFTSVSLVTPDKLRHLKMGKKSEKAMLDDQVKALQSFEGNIQTFEINGKEVPVKFNIMTFNYGVNAGAVGNIKLLFKKKLGLDTQNKINQKSLAKLEAKVEEFKDSDRYPIARALMDDIKSLNRTKSSYLNGGNQYEVGAKILALSNLLQYSQCAFNCKSGKDRTGQMDSMVKAFIIMGERRGGKIPTSKEYRQDPKLREEFVQIVIKLLIEGGGLERTGINTDARGYKVDETTNIWEMSPDDFDELVGLSKTTSA